MQNQQNQPSRPNEPYRPNRPQQPHQQQPHQQQPYQQQPHQQQPYQQQAPPEPAHRRRFWEGAWWAGAFIWAGLVLLADNAGVLPDVEGASIWSWILAGAGLYALALNVWRTVSPREPSPDGGDFFWTGVLLVLGFAGFFDFDITLPVILILLGGVLLIRALIAQRRAAGS